MIYAFNIKLNLEMNGDLRTLAEAIKKLGGEDEKELGLWIHSRLDQLEERKYADGFVEALKRARRFINSEMCPYQHVKSQK